jgi:D-3-phosphoglycerate dehydrogenase / 2-oxoglutarate reductase
MAIKVLVTDRRHASLENERAILEPLGVDVVDKFSESEDELIENGRGAIGMLVSYAKITRRVMKSLPELKIAVKYGVGYDNLDTKAAAELGVYTVNVPDYCVEEVALQALAHVMNGLRFTHYFSAEVRNGIWAKDPAAICTLHRPSGMTAGFVGYGRIARCLSGYLRPIVGSMKFFDPFVPSAEGVAKCESVEELFGACDIVSLHSPLSAQTKGIVGNGPLSGARGCILVNTSRAGLVDRTALLGALDSGKVGFFGADVGWEEPLAMDVPENAALVGRSNVSITPHMGWYSVESEKDVRSKAAMEIARVIKGGKPLHIV